MTPREYLIEARKATGLTREDAAFRLKISPFLYTMLERDDEWITHPNIALRVKKFFRLTVDQYETMVHEKHRRGRKRSVKD
jgi:DNA-binding XRE family transcriptional regulator